jgi:hypothetical protein
MRDNVFQIWTDSISNLRVSFPRRCRRYLLEKIEGIAPVQYNWISKSAVNLIRVSSAKGSRESKYLNQIFTRLLPANPLPRGKMYLPTVLICAAKDLEILPYSLQSVVKYLSDKEDLSILVPKSIVADVHRILSELEISAQIITDEHLIEKFSIEKNSFIEKAARMQLLKLLAALSLNHQELLIVDGDTIFLKSRTWTQNEKIIFPISQEFLTRHANFNRNRLNFLSNSGLGFVTHHQVVCKKCVQEIVLIAGGISILAKAMQSAFSDPSNWGNEYPSEWQFMGDFILESDKHTVVPVRFANIGIERKSIELELGKSSSSAEMLREIEQLSNKNPAIYSISLHSYK